MTLVEFIKARLDEDQHDGRRLASAGHGIPVFVEGDGEPIVIAGRRWLAEVGAKRRVVEMLGNEPNEVEGIGWDGGWHACAVAVLQYLALPYADHTDYDESWRP